MSCFADLRAFTSVGFATATGLPEACSGGDRTCTLPELQPLKSSLATL